jgi:hypothetical protein
MLLWPLFDEFLREFDYALLILEIFGVAEGQEKEGFLPRCFECRIVTVLDPFEGKTESLGILREGLSGASINCAPELIKDDDQRET